MLLQEETQTDSVKLQGFMSEIEALQKDKLKLSTQFTEAEQASRELQHANTLLKDELMSIREQLQSATQENTDVIMRFEDRLGELQAHIRAEEARIGQQMVLARSEVERRQAVIEVRKFLL